MNPNFNHSSMLRSKHLIMGKSNATRGVNFDDVKLDMRTQHKIEVMNKLAKVSLFEKLWFSFFILAGILCLIFIRPFDLPLVFGVTSLFLYLFSSNLTANGNKFGMIISMISSVLYCINCFIFKVYGEVLINLFVYWPIYVFSFISFKKNTNSENKKDEFLEVKKLNILELVLCFVALFAGSIALYYFFIYIGSAFALINAVSILAFIIGMIIRMLRYIEFWFFDFLGNIFNVVLWVLASTSDLSSIPFVLSTISCILNGIYGYIIWKKLYHKSQVSKGVLLVKRKLNIKRIIKLRRQYQNFVFNEEINENQNKREG